MPNIRLKRYNGNAWENVEVQTDWSQILNKPSTFTPTSHSHGNIQNGGTMGGFALSPGSGVNILVSGSDNTIGKSSIAFSGGGTNFLRQDGTWQAVSATGDFLPLSGGVITLASGTTSNSIFFNTAQSYTGPYLRGQGQELYRGYYTGQYRIWDAGNLDPITTSNIGSQSVNSAITAQQLHIGGTSSQLIGNAVWAGASGYPGYQFTGGNSRFGFSSTSGYVDVYTDGNFYAGIDLNGSNNLVLHSGNFADYAVRTSGQGNWSSVGTIGNVVGLLAWKNYGNSHVIFDASNSTSPSGGSVNSTNSQIAWSASYPTLMGWNGNATYGVRVDRARQADYLDGTWNTTGRNYSREWIEFPNHSGLYSPLNNAHFYPNNNTYGGWRVEGSRNGWRGLEFDTSTGGLTMMVSTDGNTIGWHHNAYGWQTMWQSGSMYVFKNTYGGGTQARVHDNSNLTFSLSGTTLTINRA